MSANFEENEKFISEMKEKHSVAKLRKLKDEVNTYGKKGGLGSMYKVM